MDALTVDALRERLAHADPAVRFNAALELARRGDGAAESAAPALVEALDHPSQVVRRRYAVAALVELGRAAAPALLAAIGAGGRGAPAAACALLRVDPAPRARVLAALLDALASEDEHARSDAAWALAELGLASPDAVAALGRLLADERQPASARFEIAGALRKLAPDAAGVDYLVNGLASADRWARRAAAEALGELGKTAATAVAALAARLRDEAEDFAVRVQAGYALAQIGQPRGDVLAALLRALRSGDWWTRVFAGRALAKLADPSAVTALARALEDPEPNVRRAATLALAELGDGAAAGVPALVGALRRESRAGLAADALARVPAALDPLVRLLGDGDRRVAGLAARALARMERPGAAEALAAAGLEPFAPAAGDFFVPAPPLDLTDGQIEAFEAMLADRGTVDPAPHPKHAFLRYCAERRGLMLHGSNHVGLDVLQPVRWSTDGNAWGNVSAVYADPDGVRPIYFAIVDRQATWGLSNGFHDRPDRAGGSCRYYDFAVDAESLRRRPWRSGMVYVLPPDTFEHAQGREWVSREPVRPLARVAVDPADFPFLDDIKGADWRLGGGWPDLDGTPFLDEARCRPIR